MRIDEVKLSAASTRAILGGQSVAEKVQDGDFWASLESAESEQDREVSVRLCKELESLNMGDAAAVADFLFNFFRDDVEDMNREQLEEAAKAFAAALG